MKNLKEVLKDLKNMHRHVEYHNYDPVFELLNGGADPNYKNYYGETLLQVAVTTSFSNFRIFKLLKSHGADLNVKDVYENTLLHLAALNSRIDCGIITFLSKHSDPNSRNLYGETPLHMAARSCNETAIRLLLDQGGNPTILNNNNDSILHLALANKNCRPDILKLLIGGGVDVNWVNMYGRNALHTFALMNSQSTDILEVLISHGADVNAKDKDINTVLHHAFYYEERGDKVVYCHQRQGGIFSTFFSRSLRNLTKPFIRSACSVEILKELIAQGADVGVKNIKGDTPLHLAALNEYISKHIVTELLRCGADINSTNEFDKTPLDIILTSNLKSIEVLRELLSNGACSFNETDDTPLHLAVENRECNRNIVQVLVKAGSSINQRNKYGSTPLHSFSLVSKNPCQLDVISELINTKDIIIDAQDNYGRTPLYFAAKNRCTCIVKKLLEAGANPNGLNLCSPLGRALIDSDYRFETVEELLHHGADPNATSNSTTSILFNFCSVSNCSGIYDLDVLELLLRNGANTGYKNKDEMAILSEFLEVQTPEKHNMEMLNVHEDDPKPPVCCEKLAVISKFALLTQLHQDVKQNILKLAHKKELCSALENYFNRCVSEIELIKSINISNGVSLYMIFAIAVRYCSSNTKQLLENNAARALEIVSQNKLPIYGKDIEYRLNAFV